MMASEMTPQDRHSAFHQPDDKFRQYVELFRSPADRGHLSGAISQGQAIRSALGRFQVIHFVEWPQFTRLGLSVRIGKRAAGSGGTTPTG
jgi:hypothetical protein